MGLFLDFPDDATVRPNSQQSTHSLSFFMSFMIFQAPKNSNAVKQFYLTGAIFSGKTIKRFSIEHEQVLTGGQDLV